MEEREEKLRAKIKKQETILIIIIGLITLSLFTGMIPLGVVALFFFPGTYTHINKYKDELAEEVCNSEK